MSLVLTFSTHKIGRRLLIGLYPVKTGWHHFNQPAQRATTIFLPMSVSGLCDRLDVLLACAELCSSSSADTDSVCMYLPPLMLIPPSLLLLVSPCAVRPRLWRERRRVMFGLSVWLLVSVSGAAGSSDSAGGAAGPSRVQPSPCDTLSVTDPLRLVTWHPLLLFSPVLVFAHHSTTTPHPPSQWPFHCHSTVSHSVSHLLLHWGVFSRSWPTCVFESWYPCFGLKLAIVFAADTLYLYLLPFSGRNYC